MPYVVNTDRGPIRGKKGRGPHRISRGALCDTARLKTLPAAARCSTPSTTANSAFRKEAGVCF